MQIIYSYARLCYFCRIETKESAFSQVIRKQTNIVSPCTQPQRDRVPCPMGLLKVCTRRYGLQLTRFLWDNIVGGLHFHTHHTYSERVTRNSFDKIFTVYLITGLDTSVYHVSFRHVSLVSVTKSTYVTLRNICPLLFRR
jgi:hypothetical protein